MTEEEIVWKRLVAYAKRYAELMNMNQTVVIKKSGIKIMTNELSESFRKKSL